MGVEELRKNYHVSVLDELNTLVTTTPNAAPAEDNVGTTTLLLSYAVCMGSLRLLWFPISPIKFSLVALYHIVQLNKEWVEIMITDGNMNFIKSLL